MNKGIRKFIGDREFYKLALSVAVPMMIQNGITNFVSLLDNIMVGRVGTEQMSGIAIDNQLLFIFNLAIFGALSGVGIFGAQFYGCRDKEGLVNAFRVKLYITVILFATAILVYTSGQELLISLFLHDANETAVAATMGYAKTYINIMLFGLLPFGLEQVYSSSLRECGETVVPMKAGVTAVFVNLALNYILIFGKLGAPKLGVAGAALATVISRYVQLAIVVIWTHRHSEQIFFIGDVYKSFKVPGKLLGNIAVRGIPLMLNEILWSLGMTVENQSYSTRGLSAVAAINISSTVGNLFNVTFMSMGGAIGIIVGQLLGAGKMEEARDKDTKMIAFSTFLAFITGILIVILAPLFPAIYNTSDEVKNIATMLLRVSGCMMVFFAFTHASYFTLRSGGKTMITFLFDSAFLWVIGVPVAFVLSRFTSMNIILLYFCVTSIEIIKSIVGYFFVKSGKWINNIVN